MSEQNTKQINKETCDQNMKIIMLQVEQTMLKSINQVADKFEASLAIAKDNFATKKELEKVDTKVETMKTTQDNRQYDWLKYAITTAIMIIITMSIQK